MKKVLILVVASLFICSSAIAGVGLGWENGVSVKIPAGPVNVQGVLGLRSFSPDVGDSSTEINLTGFVMYPIIEGSGNSKMSVFGGVGIDSITDFDMGLKLAVGIAPGVMVTDNIGICGKLGLMFEQIAPPEDVDPDSQICTMGSIGIHWFFLIDLNIPYYA